MPLIPAVDVLGDEAVRLEQGDFDRVLFRMDLEALVERIAATRPELIHVVDLEGARDGELRLGIVDRCLAAAGGIPIQVSGGIRSIGLAARALEAGVARVIVGTAAWSSGDAMEAYVDALGTRLVVGCDVRDGRVASHGWRGSTGLDVDEALRRCVGAGAARLHVTANERDGTLRGPDLELYRRFCDSGLPIVAAGGVRDDRDAQDLHELGCEAVVMGLGLLGRLGVPVTGPGT